MIVKLRLYAVLILFLTGGIGGAYAGPLDAERAGSLMVVKQVDLKKRMIYTFAVNFAYNSLTRFYDMRGDKTDISAVVPGSLVSFDVDENERYLIAPTATVVKIESDQPLPLPSKTK